jgi:acyl-CoA synthetase (AMP-forming)/AMP-acid ligase II
MPVGPTTDTLAALHLAVERRHERDAVMRRWTGERWDATPDWRFHRHVMRVALYLAERAGVKHGDAVALVASMSPEWLVADWATVIQGAVAVVVDADITGAALAAAWSQRRPRVVFVDDAGALERVTVAARAAETPLETVIAVGALEADLARASGARVVAYSEALDLGGTLDTAERANAMRAIARQVRPSTEAVAHLAAAEPTTHGDVVGRVRTRWSSSPARKGDVVVAPRGVPSPAVHVNLYGHVADGASCLSFGR